MSDQQVTEPEIACIKCAPKTLGQVGYEAMLATVTDVLDDAGLECFPVKWEEQPEAVRSDWEAVAAAIAKEVKL